MIAQNEQALTARFVAEWPSTIPVLYQHGPARARPTTGIYVEFMIVPGETILDSGSVDLGYLRAKGRVWLHVYAPEQSFKKPINEALEKFVSIFRFWDDDPAIHCFAENVGSGPVASEQSGYVRYQISVSYESVRAI